MNNYKDYMNNISADPALQESIAARTSQKPKAFYRRPAFAGLAAGMTVVLLAVLAIPVLNNNQAQRLPDLEQASPENYYAAGAPDMLPDRPVGDDSDTVIEMPGVDPISPGATPLPPMRGPVPDRVELSLNEARHDPNFGTFIPASIPEGFVFESAQYSDGTLSASWNRGVGVFDHINWVVHFSDEQWENSVVSASQRELFDIALYPMPWMDSVPAEIAEVFHFPVFRAEELSLEVVQARMRWEEAGEGRLGTTAGWRHAPFAVLYGDVLVQPRVNGVTPEQLYDMLAGLS